MRTAFVTGGAGGIGDAIVRRLARDGFRVVIGCNASADRARALAEEIDGEVLIADLSDGASLERLADTLRTRGIDVLVNNAGVCAAGLLQDMSVAEIRRVIDVDLTAAVLLSRAVLPHMISVKYGRIVNVSSIWGVAGGSCEVAYSAAKAGLIGLTKALAREVGPSGITVNAVAPGVVRTAMTAMYDGDTLASLADESAAGRLGTPDDIAAAVSYFVRDEASFATGQVLVVDGGMI